MAAPAEADADINEAAKIRAGLLPVKQTKSLNDFLREAAENGDATEIRRLVAAGADVNTKDVLSKTPMHLAAIRSHTEALVALKELGGDPDARAMGNKRPIDWVGKPGSNKLPFSDREAENEAALALLQSWAAGAA